MFLRVKVLVLIDSFLNLNFRFHLLIYTSSFSLSVVFFYAFLMLNVRTLALSFSTYFSSSFPVSACTTFELFLYPYADLTEQVCYFCRMVWVYQDWFLEGQPNLGLFMFVTLKYWMLLCRSQIIRRARKLSSNLLSLAVWKFHKVFI